MRMNIECLKNVHQKRWIGCGGRTSQTLSPAKQLFNSWKHFFKIVPSLWKLSWGHTAYNKWRNIHSRKYTKSRQEHWGSAPLPTPFPSHWLPYPDRAGPRRWVGSSPSLPSSCRGADFWHFFLSFPAPCRRSSIARMQGRKVQVLLPLPRHPLSRLELSPKCPGSWYACYFYWHMHLSKSMSFTLHYFHFLT